VVVSSFAYATAAARMRQAGLSFLYEASRTGTVDTLISVVTKGLASRTVVYKSSVGSSAPNRR
jgi:hypothetical protein